MRRGRSSGSSPRVRGTLRPRQPLEPPNGSSPRVRGTRMQSLCHRSSDRFIPARAGNTASRRQRRARARFIPARAGNTPDALGPSSLDPVHPRACGEHGSPRHAVTITHGSSPRVRGTRTVRQVWSVRAGSSPRVRGTLQPTASSFAGASGSSPRVRGTRHAGVCSGLVVGSSPRVRGTRHSAATATCSTRFIPARAGNTSSSRRGRRHGPVHPRACGEHVSAS